MTDPNTRTTNHHGFLAADRAASPVVGVVLMIAIAVALAAVVGAFTLEIGGEQRTTPQAKFTFEHTGSGLTVDHVGGAAFDSKNTHELRVVGGGSADGDSPWFDGSDPVSAGDTYTVADTGRLDPGTTVKVVWIGPDGDRSQVLASTTVP